MNIKIEKVSEEDANLYAELKLQIWRTCYHEILPEKYLDSISVLRKAEKYRKEIQQDLQTEYYFILVSDTPAGVLRLNYNQTPAGDMCVCIKDFYFLQQYQRKGYGGFVLNFIIKQAKEHHCHLITAWIIEGNQPARLVISKLGFHQTSTTQVHEKTGVILLKYQYDLYNRPKLLIR